LKFHFEQAHKVYANLLEIGYKPLVELSFLPKALAADPAKTCCFYRGYCSQPTSYKEWGDLIHAFGASLVKRFGISEVSEWRFAVWNEPNGGFWAPVADPFEEYMKLYEAAARALKKVSSRIRVGGPSTMVAGWTSPGQVGAQDRARFPFGQGGPCDGDGWIERFIRRCQARKIPLDFIETHLYPMDEYELFGEKTRERSGPFDFFPKTIAKTNKTIRSMLPDTDIIWGEWSSNHRVGKKGLPFWDRSLSPETFQNNPQFDTPFGGVFAAKVAGTFLDGTRMCWWVGSDVYEEWGWRHLPYHCGYGLLTIHGIPKPSAHAHHFAYRLDGGNILNHWSENGAGFLSVRKGGENLLLFWNFSHPELPRATDALDLRQAGFRIGKGSSICLVDDQHANGKAIWERLGRPEELDQWAEAKIRKGSALVEKGLPKKVVVEQKVMLSPNAFGLIVSR
jgi:xylan 1,4-beta-xylosidase